MAHIAQVFRRVDRRAGARHISTAAASLVVGFLAAGCGGGSSTASSGSGNAKSSPRDAAGDTSAGSQLAMVAQAEAICNHLNQRFDAEGRAGTTIADIARVTPRRAVVETQAVRELQALTPPTQLARDWQKIVSYRQTLAAELAKLGRAAKAEDTAAIRGLAVTKKRNHERLGLLAKRTGFRECARMG